VGVIGWLYGIRVGLQPDPSTLQTCSKKGADPALTLKVFDPTQSYYYRPKGKNCNIWNFGGNFSIPEVADSTRHKQQKNELTHLESKIFDLDLSQEGIDVNKRRVDVAKWREINVSLRIGQRAVIPYSTEIQTLRKGKGQCLRRAISECLFCIPYC